MDSTNNVDLPLPQPSPVRVLVQTLTHLVPADGKVYKPERNPGNDKVFSMLHRICQHIWGRPFNPYDPKVFRWYSYGGNRLGYNNRPCFFLVDHGRTDHDADVPILPYKWTGEEFKPMPELLLSKDVQDELKDTPFTPAPPSSEPRQQRPVRDEVRSMLRGAERIPDEELEFVKGCPEDMEWLKRKLRPRFYENLLAQIEARPRENEEDERDGLI